MTGAPVPAGCDAVVMQEQTESRDGGIVITAPVRAGQNIRRIGEDIQAGKQVLDAGVRLGAAELPLLASLGIAEVSVLRKLRVPFSPPVTNCRRSASRWPRARFMTPTASPWR